MYIWNDGVMPTNLTSTEKLFQKHSSKPYNPKLADIFFKSGMIEAWGRGFDKIKEACEKYNGPLPEYDISENGIMVLCKACDKYLKLLSIADTDKTSVKNNDRSLTEVLSEREIKRFASILEYLKEHDRITNKIGRELTGKSESSVKRYLNRLREVGILRSEGSTSDTEYFKN